MKIIILAGGSGTRFWPKSVKAIPKQFLALTSERTMIQETYLRFQEWLPPKNIFVATIEQYVETVKEQLPWLSEEQIIVEPMPRDTGPCIALTASNFLNHGDDEVLVTMPSDHYISDTSELRRVLDAAESKAKQSACIVTLGVPPSRPEIGYGYIETQSEETQDGIYKVNHFFEKPSIEKAQQFIERKHMFWNSGIFIWKPSTIAHYMMEYHGSMWSILTGSAELIKERYAELPKISIDYAILEKAEEIYCIPVGFKWDDIGLWSSMERIYPVDSDGNLLHGNIHALNTTDTTVISDHKQTIVIGLDHAIVVHTEFGLLICNKSEVHKVKDILQRIEMESVYGVH
ncbi:mannose-1-phosphate guanylyltransferase [Cohnella endophytica]|uniref:Mannose-1-phosphate guanylyltransferase n=1 Tax=Cohnella endophytica TaxID=2419778 RepID=A0A494Y0F1_9BACL|nr:sugar phosphate nucleotidyltransferase [Cohnella endophytica]RKP56236.1 mannose-1-phosphate guanylyltransferase [Cohnella endophytica]